MPHLSTQEIKEQLTHVCNLIDTALPGNNDIFKNKIHNIAQLQLIGHLDNNASLSIMDISFAFQQMHTELFNIEKEKGVILSAPKQALDQLNDNMVNAIMPQDEPETIDDLLSKGVPQNKKDRKKLKNKVMAIMDSDDSEPELSPSAVVLNIRGMKEPKNNSSNKNKP